MDGRREGTRGGATGRGTRVPWPVLAVGLALGGLEVAALVDPRQAMDLPEVLAWVGAACVVWGILAGLLRLVLGRVTRGWPGRRTGRVAWVVLVGSAFVIAERARSPTPPLDRGAEHASTSPDVLLLTVVHPQPARALAAGAGPTLDRLVSASALVESLAVPEGSAEVALLSLMTGRTTPGSGRPEPERALGMAYTRTWHSLVELLAGDGYLAGGFAPLPLPAPLSAWRRAFHVYDDGAGRRGGATRALLLAPILGPRPTASGLASRTLRRARRFHEGAGTHRLFLWVHLPEAALARDPLPADAAIGRMLEVVDARGRRDDTLVVLALLPSAGDPSPPSTRRAALLLRHPGLVPAGVRIACPAVLGDLGATVADLLGNLDPTRGGGVSLRAALAGGPCPARVETPPSRGGPGRGPGAGSPDPRLRPR